MSTISVEFSLLKQFPSIVTAYCNKAQIDLLSALLYDGLTWVTVSLSFHMNLESQVGNVWWFFPADKRKNQLTVNIQTTSYKFAGEQANGPPLFIIEVYNAKTLYI